MYAARQLSQAEARRRRDNNEESIRKFSARAAMIEYSRDAHHPGRRINGREGGKDFRFALDLGRLADDVAGKSTPRRAFQNGRAVVDQGFDAKDLACVPFTDFLKQIPAALLTRSSLQR